MEQTNFINDKQAKIFIAGHAGMVGGAIKKHLESLGYENLIVQTRKVLDLTNQTAVDAFFKEHSPQYVFLAAAKVGGIHSNNSYPAEFIYDNLMIECNVINAAKTHNVKRLMMLGSTCIYPKLAAQPMSESSLLTGPLEPTNEPYAIAKIAGIKLCESYNRQYGCDFRSVMPTNLYGPGDNFHPENSHVIPAMMMRFEAAKQNKIAQVEVWGTGTPLREFLHVSDMAAATTHLMSISKEDYSSITSPMRSHINIGDGVEVSIGELAHTIKKVVGYEGEIFFNSDRPDGTPRKLCSTELLKKTGWEAKISLEEGLKDAYDWYLNNKNNVRQK